MESLIIESLQFFGPWVYVFLFLVIFCETGLVITPFLPGDSLLFVLGTLAALEASTLNLPILIGTLSVAAILGDIVNYMIGYHIGPKIFRSQTGRWLNQKHLVSTQIFYEKHGGKTVFFARFLPIFRTFAPFVAGIGQMDYSRFAFFNISGGLIWIGSFLLGGYFFGNIPVVQRHFEIVVFGIIFLSFLPLVLRTFRQQTT